MTSPTVPLRRLVLAAAVTSLLPLAAQANVTLPAQFSDHMVLQRDVAAVPVWGWADEGEEVTVAFAGQIKKVTAGTDKKWTVKLDALKVGEPAELTVQGKNQITIKDVLVGEVWLCSGQSNMGFTVNRAVKFEEEKAAADLPQIRVFTERSGGATEPQEKGAGTWAVCTPDAVGSFSATAYFFGRELYKSLKIPVGLINSSVGGTPIEAWTSAEAQKDVAEVKPIYAEWEQKIAAFDSEKAKAAYEAAKAGLADRAAKAKAAGQPAPRPPQLPVEPRKDGHYPANLFNGKIAPLIPYAIRGAIWYQGESNANTVERGAAYRKQLPLLIQDWRQRWGAEFPFAWVQLPDFDAHSSEGWALVQEAMLKSLKVPHTGMAVALGLGEAKDIHPKRKQEVGQRLATWAMAEVYAKKGGKSAPALSMGPLFSSHNVSGKEVIIAFKQSEGLAAKDGELKGFTIAGEDQQWKPATAKIMNGHVVVSSPDVAKPAAVRYAWGSNPEWSLVNAAGLPASPFRTDDWPVAEAAPAKPAAAPVKAATAPAPAKQ